jgi:fumarate reductase flavoprotein subunit
VLIPPGTKIPDIDARLQRIVDDGEAFAANSIEELAARIGVEAVRLKATVEAYNRCCDQGHDDLFAKDPKYLRPVRTPKFYAMRGYPSCMSTLGGIKINHKTEVLDQRGEVIPGLYAAGNCAGGFYGGHYHLVTTGGASAFALNGGRIAGENALKRAGIEPAPLHGRSAPAGKGRSVARQAHRGGCA